MPHDDEPTQNPNEQFSEAVERLQGNLTTETNRMAEAGKEYADCVVRLFARWVTSIRNIRTSFEEYAVIQPQLVLDWYVLSDTQRQAIVELDTNFRTLDKEIDLMHLGLAQLRDIAKSWGPELSTGQQAIEEGGTSIRDDLRRIHEITIQLWDDLKRSI